MKKIAGLLLLAALAVPGVALAQGRPEMRGRMQGPGGPGRGGPGPMMHGRDGMFGAWWKDSEVAKQIELTPEQSKQIEQKFTESRLKLIDERADLEKQETLLGSMMEEDRPDEARVGAQLDKVVAARGRLEKENAMMMLSIRRVLSVEQWKKLQALQHERERMGGMNWMRRAPGPGGPGRRPGPPLPPKQPTTPQGSGGPDA
jgi:protein CpxP